uniref:Dynein light chain n=1 Tax=Phlebotomus papatasi TaxID=29031 RepID=A0A1B0D7R5_PHLPP
MPTTMKYMPSYRMESKNPYKREICETIIREVVNDMLSSFVYANSDASQVCNNISEEIKSRVKTLGFDRYKLVCIVTIGEKYYQSFTSTVKFLWDAEKDGYANYVYDTQHFFAIATLYALYYD